MSQRYGSGGTFPVSTVRKWAAFSMWTVERCLPVMASITSTVPVMPLNARGDHEVACDRRLAVAGGLKVNHRGGSHGR